MTCWPGSPRWSTARWRAPGRSATAPRRSSCSAGWARSGGGWAATCSTPTARSRGPPPSSTRLFADLSGWSVIDELRRDEADSRVTSTEIAQPANFLVQVGLTAELAHYGVHPKADRRAQRRRGQRRLRQRHAQPAGRGQSQLPPRAAAGHHRRVGRDARCGSAAKPRRRQWISRTREICASPAVNSPSGVTLAGSHSAIAEMSDELTDRGCVCPATAGGGALPLAPDGPDPAEADARSWPTWPRGHRSSRCIRR